MKNTTAARKALFLTCYARIGVIGPACDASGISRSSYKGWRKEDGDFDEACDLAFQQAVDLAELELRRRAIEGVDDVVMYKGEPVWRRNPDTGDLVLDDDFEPVPFVETRYSDRLLEVYVKAHRQIYRERSALELGGPDGKPFKTEVEVRYVLPDGKTVEDYDGPQGDGG